MNFLLLTLHNQVNSRWSVVGLLEFIRMIIRDTVPCSYICNSSNFDRTPNLDPALMVIWDQVGSIILEKFSFTLDECSEDQQGRKRKFVRVRNFY